MGILGSLVRLMLGTVHTVVPLIGIRKRRWTVQTKVRPHTQVVVDKLPKCDYCGRTFDEMYDAKTIYGYWAYLCPYHWGKFTDCLLGLGKGQKLILKDRK